MSHPPHVTGELVVIALKAEKLQHQAPGKQDPFCLFRIGDHVKRTKIDHGGGLYPIWDDQVNIPVTAGYHQMHVQVFDKDTMPNNLMGEGVVDLSKVLREKEHDGYFPLQYRGQQHCGDIYLELTFYSAQNTAVRPQQQVRYPAGPGYPQSYGRPLPHPPQHHRPPPPQHQYQPQPQHHPLQHHPSLHQPIQLQPMHQPPQHHTPVQHRPPPQHHTPVQHHQPPQHRPLPQRPPPPQQQQHMSQHQMHRPPPPMQRPPPPMQQQQQQRPLQNRPPPMNIGRPHYPQPSTSMGTQHFSPVMPSPQPLLSAAYNPAPSSRPPANYQPYAAGHEQQQRPMYPARPNNYNPRPYPPY